MQVRQRPLSRNTLREAVRAAQHLGFTLSELQSADRHVSISRARQFVAYHVRSVTEASYPELGYLLKRDHTTIIAACRRVQKLLDSGDHNLRKLLQDLRASSYLCLHTCSRPGVRSCSALAEEGARAG